MEKERESETNKIKNYHREYRKKRPGILVRLHDLEQKNLLENWAKEKGISVNEYVLLSLFDKKRLNKMTSIIDKSMIVEVKRIGTNINQIAKKINTQYGEINLNDIGKVLNEYLINLKEILGRIEK